MSPSFRIVEKGCRVAGGAGFTIGLANIAARGPDLAENRQRVLAALAGFAERGVNMAVFPEFCLSGGFWEERAACQAALSRAALNRQCDWIADQVVPLLDGSLRYVVLNGVVEQPGAPRPFRNVTCVVDAAFDGLRRERTYSKIFLPGIEADYTVSGGSDRLVLDTPWGRLGFLTCFDLCFPQLVQEYALADGVDGIVAVAAWRGGTARHYPQMGAGADCYYGHQWEILLPAHALSHQIWMFACNAVGRHRISGWRMWGGSGVWAPSGIRLIAGSHAQEELLIVHDLGIRAARRSERADFDFAGAFLARYHPIAGKRAFSRMP